MALGGGGEVEVRTILRKFVEKNGWDPTGQEFSGTLLKVLENVLNRPEETKFQSLKKTVKKLFGDTADPCSSCCGARPGAELLAFAKWANNDEGTHVTVTKDVATGSASGLEVDRSALFLL